MRCLGVSHFEAGEELSALIHEELIKIIHENGLESKFPIKFLNELSVFSSLQRKNILDIDATYSSQFSYDFGKFQGLKSLESHEEILMEKECDFIFIFSLKQKALIANYIKLYGCDSIDALGRFLMRSRLTDMLRIPVRSGLADKSVNNAEIVSGLESFYSYN